MRMSTKGQYAIVALTFMKRQFASGRTNPVRIEEISKSEDISQHYLEQLFRKLRVAGIVRSIRGPGGGYVLKEGQISYKSVLEAVKEEVSLRGAISDKTEASNDVVQNLTSIYKGLTDDFENTTI